MKTHALLALLALTLVSLAAPADYNAVSGYGNNITGGVPSRRVGDQRFSGLDGPFYDAEESEVKMENIALASEVDEGNGFIRLGFTLTLRNAGPGYYEELFIEWEPVGEEWAGVQVGDAFGYMPDLIPDGTTSRPQPFEVRVPAAARDAAVADVLAGKHLRPIGIELFQFNKPTVAIDEATDLAYASDELTGLPRQVKIVFSTSTPLLAALQPGTLLVESAYRYKLLKESQGNPGPKLSKTIHSAETQGSDEFTKIPQASIVEVESVTPQQDGSVWVLAHFVFFDAVMDTGTIYQRVVDAFDSRPDRDIYRPPVGDNLISRFIEPYQVRETAEEFQYNPTLRDPGRMQFYASDNLKFGFRAIHIPFNEVEIFNAIKLDGEILLDALNIEMKVRYRYLVPRKITMKIASKAELTMRLSAGAGAGNKDRPLFEKEKTFPAIPLAEIVFAIGPFPIEIAPMFKAKIGAIVDAPTNIVIPLHGSVEAGCVMGWDADRPQGDQVFFRPFSKGTPLQVSNPLLNDSLAFTAQAYAEAGIEVQVNRSAGPYAGARVSANFELNPTLPKWWSLDFDYQTSAEFRLSILGFNLPTKIGGLVGDPKRLFRKESEVPLPGGSGAPGGSPPGSFDPVSGAETRWARKAGTFPGRIHSTRVPGTDEDIFTITEALLVSPPITRMDARGNVVWSKGASLVAPQRIAPTPDGGLVFVAGTLVVWMDGNGNATAARSFQPLDDDNMTNSVFYPGYGPVLPGIPTPPHGYIGTETLAFNVVPLLHHSASPAPPTFTDVETSHSGPLQKDTIDVPLTPTAETLAADTARSRATLHGVVDALGKVRGTAYFEWSEDFVGAPVSTTPRVNVPRNERNIAASAGVTGLTNGTHYRARVVFETGGATYYGDYVTFVPRNNPPVARRDDFVLSPTETSHLPVLSNDTDADGDPLTITLVGTGHTAPAAISPDGKTIILEADENAGPRVEYFNYTVSDGLDTDEAQVLVHIGYERPDSSTVAFFATTGAAVPDDTLTNATWTSFGLPAISDNGSITATATFRSRRRTESAIYFSTKGLEESLLARTDAEVLPGVKFTSFGDPAISPNGAVAFTAKIKGTGINSTRDDGLWTNLAGGGMQRLIAEGATLPFLNGALVSQIASFSIRDGEILALLTLKPGNGVNATNDSLLVRVAPDGSGEILAREGSAVSVTDPAIVSRISALMPAPGSNGHARTHGEAGSIAKLTTTAPRREKIVAFPDVCLTSNTDAPGFGAGVKWDKFGLPAINTAGNAWTAHTTLKLGGTTAQTDTALVFHDFTANPLTIVAQENGIAPDTTAAFASFLDPLVNSDQHVAFTATLRGSGVTRTNATGIWSGPANAPSLLARAGDPATNSFGAPLDGTTTWKSFTTHALPGGAGPVFLAQLAGPGVTPDTRTALFAQDSGGVLRQMLRTGTPFGGKTIKSLALLAAGNGPFDASRSFNAAGNLALRVTFTDRSQALVRIDVP